MSEPWFAPVWLPGLVLGAACVLFAVAVILVPSARPGRAGFARLHALLTALAVVMIVLGALAFFLDQPGDVTQNLFVSGTVGVVLMLGSISMVRRSRQ